MDVNGSNRGIRIARWVVILWCHGALLCYLSLFCIWQLTGRNDVYMDWAFIVCIAFMLPSSVLLMFLVIAVMIDGRRYLDWAWWRIIWAYFAMGIPGYGVFYYRWAERQLLAAEANRRIRRQTGEYRNPPIPACGYCLIVYFVANLVGFVAIVLSEVIEWQTPEEQKLEWLHREGAALLSTAEVTVRGIRSIGGPNADRVKRAGEILLNATFDDTAVIHRMYVPTEDQYEDIFFEMQFVDENNIVTQVNYCASEDKDSGLGSVFATEEVLGPEIGRVGTTTLRLLLRADTDMSDGTSPDAEMDEIELAFFTPLLLPEDMLDDITTQKGQFILLDKDGKVLDRARPRDFGYGVQDGDGD